MSGDPQRLPDDLSHIAEAIERIERIERHTAGMDQRAFHGNPLEQDAVTRNFEVIGEASRNVETRHPDFATEHLELPLAVSHQMRSALVHGHFKVDLDIGWTAIAPDPADRHVRIVRALDTLR